MTNDPQTPTSCDPKSSCACSGGRFDAIAFAAACAVAVVLGFAAFAKLYSPDPNRLFFGTQFKLDVVVAIAEIPVVAYILIRHRCKYAWALMAILFAGFAGYSTYWSLSQGQPCGCFGVLWEPPRGFTVVLDSLLALISLGMIYRRGGRLPLLGAAVFASVVGGFVGYHQAYRFSPEKAQKEAGGLTAPERLLACSLLDDARSGGEFGYATLVFIHTKGCSTCAAYLDTMRFHEVVLAENDDLFLRVVTIDKDDALAGCGIEHWAWDGSPVAFLVQGGTVAKQWVNDELPFDIAEQLYNEISGGADYPY